MWVQQTPSCMTSSCCCPLWRAWKPCTFKHKTCSSLYSVFFLILKLDLIYLLSEPNRLCLELPVFLYYLYYLFWDELSPLVWFFCGGVPLTPSFSSFLYFFLLAAALLLIFSSPLLSQTAPICIGSSLLFCSPLASWRSLPAPPPHCCPPLWNLRILIFWMNQSRAFHSCDPSLLLNPLFPPWFLSLILFFVSYPLQSEIQLLPFFPTLVTCLGPTCIRSNG